MMLEQGFQLHMAGDLAGAARVYQKILAQDPGNAEALNLLGVIALQGEDYGQATRLISQAIALDEANPGYLNNLGQALDGAKNPGGAAECYEKSLILDPGNADVLNNLGVSLHEMNRLDEARTSYELALALEADDPEIHHNYGVLLQELGLLGEAAAAYRRALELNPRMESTHLSLGSTFNELGNKKTALEAYFMAIEINPFYLDAHEAIKAIHWDSGNLENMDESYYRACDILPGSSEAHSNLGRALIFSRQLGDAEKALKKAITLDDDNAEAHSQMGRIHAKQKNYDAAIAEHRKAISLERENAYFREELGDTLLAAGDTSQAQEELLKGHQLNDRRSSILAHLSIAMNENEDASVADFVDYDRHVSKRLIEVPDGFDSLQTFNDALHNELEKRHKNSPPPPGQTMRGGTQIPNALFTHATGLTAVVQEKITKALKDYIDSLEPDPKHPFLRYVNPNFRFTGAWSTILHGAGYDSSHIHNEGWLSGVYYVKVPDLAEKTWAKGEGCIQFGEPPPHYVSARNQSYMEVRPEVGMTVFFPSYYWHGVQPFTEPGLRHSIAFDII